MDRIAYIIGQTFIFWSSIILALAALVAVCWFLGLYLSRSGNYLGGFLAVPFAFVLSLVLSRLVHWYCRSDSYASFEAAMTDFTVGGYALVGVFAGCLLTACLLRLLQAVKNLPQMLDCMSLAGAAGIAVGRLASLFNSSDRGDIIEGITELPLVFPVSNSVTGALEYRLATFMLQALVTGGIFALLLIFWMAMKRKGKDGDTCLMFLLLYGAAQAVFDSTRYDSLYLRSNGFVSMVQIVGAVALVFAFVMFAVRMCRARGFRFWYLALWISTLGLLGGAGYMEYYVQRHGDKALMSYTVMTGCLIGVILIGIATYVLAVVGEAVKTKKCRRCGAGC
jgi:prolipoprotein diacylglyceryltransferase